MKTRVDVALVERGMIASRERAQALIMAGQIYIGERKVLKASETVEEKDELILRGEVDSLSSRGGHKILQAIEHFKADVTDVVAMDIGAAAGGFTDVLLRHGAKHVYSIDSGYSVEDALRAINCIMLSATDGEQYATVDLCMCDLWNEQATLYKLGACPSILLSGGSMRTLQSSALPLGILPEIEASTHTFAIADGDLLIQFSDGLTDALGGLHALEGQISLLARDKLQKSPETVCTALMSAAMRRCGGVPPDDMTILCTRFKSTKK